MKAFMDEDFILKTETAKKLYHDFSEKLPIIDYHCHINPQEIYEDRKFNNITEVWLGGDHYKWRIMRANGVAEEYVTGNGDPKEKFIKYAESLERAIGNPLYHWSHLELKRYFNYDGILNKKTASEVYDMTSDFLQKPEFSVRNLIRRSNVEVICTTDDPKDDLKWHKLIKEDKSIEFKVLPAWRPDKAMNIDKPDFIDYITALAEVSEVSIDSFDSLKNALEKRLFFFNEMGCKVSDHGLDYVAFEPFEEEEVGEIFKKRLSGETLTVTEVRKYKTAFMVFMGVNYHKLDWVMQLHYGAQRNVDKKMFSKLGPDTGYDCIENYQPGSELSAFLNALKEVDALPKTIVYSLNPIDNTMIDTIIGSFQDGTIRGKMQHGSAWWFNDHKAGMTEQMTTLANEGVLGNFIGMLTDSRSFLSYTRHEYFRRILCDLLGSFVENGEYPCDMDVLKEITEGISYYNAKEYFNF